VTTRIGQVLSDFFADCDLIRLVVFQNEKLPFMQVPQKYSFWVYQPTILQEYLTFAENNQRLLTMANRLRIN